MLQRAMDAQNWYNGGQTDGQSNLRWEFIIENKNSTKKVIKKKETFSFFLGRVLVFLIAFLVEFLFFFLTFFFSFINSHNSFQGFSERLTYDPNPNYIYWNHHMHASTYLHMYVLNNIFFFSLYILMQYMIISLKYIFFFHTKEPFCSPFND